MNRVKTSNTKKSANNEWVKHRDDLLRFFLTVITTALLFNVNNVFGQYAPIHDPSNLVHENGRYWTFGTDMGIRVVSASDKNFSDWRDEPSVFPRDSWPSWIRDYVPDFRGHFWAPDCIYLNGRYYLYYTCSTTGSHISCIGAASSASLSNPEWTDHGLVISSSHSSPYNAIDPDVFFDQDKRLWMTWGSFWDGIFLTELNPSDGKVIDINKRYRLANNGCEAAAIIYHDGYYYLFFNRGSCCSGVDSTYYILVGRSKEVTGPYLDKSGRDCKQNGGTIFLDTVERFIGPGHFGLCDGILTYHFYDAKRNGWAMLKTSNLYWKKGWPYADPVVSSLGAPTGENLVIKNRSDNRVLQANGDKPGGNVTAGDWNGKNDQRWKIEYVGEGLYVICSAQNDNLVLECQERGGVDETHVILNEYLGEDSQKWILVDADDDCWRIAPHHAGAQSLCMLENANAGLLSYREDASQQWRIADAGKGDTGKTASKTSAEKINAPTKKPVAHYKFDGDVNDVGGSGKNGSITGNVEYVSGVIGQAIDLNGLDNFITLPADIVTSDDVTIAAWVNWDGGAPWQRVFDFGNGVGEYIMLTPLTPPNGPMRFCITTNSVAGQENIETKTLPRGQWTHVAVTLKDDAGAMYVNGFLASLGKITQNPSDVKQQSNYIGKSQWPDPLFDGCIDELRIYDYALSSAEIASLASVSGSNKRPELTADSIEKPDATTGKIYHQTLLGDVSDLDGDILDFTKIYGPAWLDIRSSGDLIGTPERKAIGVNRFVVQVNDNKGGVNQVMLKINVQAGRCDPTPTTPYSRVDGGLWQRTGDVTLKEGQTVVLGPQPISGGTWNWIGPNGFEADRREIELSKMQPDQAGAYTAIFTNDCGAESRQIFNITLSAMK